MHAMHLTSLIDSRLIFLENKLKDITEIYDFMLSHIYKHFQLIDPKEELIERLLKRELNEGILFPTGTAIPHLHLENFNDTLISILIPEKPIETEYGIIKIFFMVITGKHDNSLYLHILQSVIKMSKDTEVFEKVLTLKSSHDLLTLLKSGDFAVKRAITVSDLMSKNIITVKPTTTLKELSHIFYETYCGYFPVVNDTGNLIGEVTVLDYIMSGFPAYTNFLSNLNFLKSFEPFERLIKEEHLRYVESIMRPVEIHINSNESIFEALFLMKKYNRRDLPVIEDKKIIGLISFMDIFRKVIKG
ncbi:MAG: CBS domain-containing protein [Candidatus Cloacimonetes bacterium]|nr:CBS domain-containing protein [Candidatus Cloacimonadota bacterium]